MHLTIIGPSKLHKFRQFNGRFTHNLLKPSFESILSRTKYNKRHPVLRQERGVAKSGVHERIPP
mgnify:CR=1 FL=1